MKKVQDQNQIHPLIRKNHGDRNLDGQSPSNFTLAGTTCDMLPIIIDSDVTFDVPLDMSNCAEKNDGGNVLTIEDSIITITTSTMGLMFSN